MSDIFDIKNIGYIYQSWTGFSRPEFSGRHDFQAKKFGRQCTKSGSHAVRLQEKSSKNLMQNKTYYICITNTPPTQIVVFTRYSHAE